eukprot:4230993-Pleurochrysis_carterae.AAC.1
MAACECPSSTSRGTNGSKICSRGVCTAGLRPRSSSSGVKPKLSTVLRTHDPQLEAFGVGPGDDGIALCMQSDSNELSCASGAAEGQRFGWDAACTTVGVRNW